MTLTFQALPTAEVQAIRTTGHDHYGNPVERQTSAGDGDLCRHCLQNFGPGEEHLVLAYRPFSDQQPYAETGPLYLCATDCQRASDTSALPPTLQSPHYLVKGYTANERIRYDTGKIVANAETADYIAEIFAHPEVAFVDIRSSLNNCFQCRVVRG